MVTQEEKDMLSADTQPLCNYPDCTCPFDLHSDEKCMLGRPRKITVPGADYGAVGGIPAAGKENPTPLKVKRVRGEAKLPTYAHPNDACFDLHTVDSGYLPPKQFGVFGTGLAFDVPPGYCMLVFSRSGMGFNQGVRLVNCVGVIDPGYHNEVMVGLFNDSGTTRVIDVGNRIAQAIILPRPQISIEEVQQFNTDTRGSAGFGGTGR